MCWTGHFQTILGHLLRGSPTIQNGERIEIVLDDGDVLVGQLYLGRKDILVTLFHGLAGDTSSGYIVRTAQLCREQGYSVLVVNHRGCGAGETMTARKPYHAGRSEDLSSVIEFARRTFPKARIFSVGFSLSGNALLLLMAGERGTHKPDAAIAVNAPIDMESTARNLSRGLNRIYDFVFVQKCRKLIDHKIKMGWIESRHRISVFSRVYDIDARYTALQAGFVDRDEFYRKCSSKAYLHRIDRPTVMIASKDDPFVDFREYETATLSPTTSLLAKQSGGHLGYLELVPGSFKCRHGLERMIWNVLEDQIDLMSGQSSLGLQALSFMYSMS